EASHRSYLLQKRALGLDKPILLNFNGFRDYRPQVRAAAYFLGQPTAKLEHDLPELAHPASGSEAAERRQFLDTLKISNLAGRLAEPQEHRTLARNVVDYVQVWCEDAGTTAVPAAIELLRSTKNLVLERGAIRALDGMCDDPFVYTYSRNPSAAETPAVTLS